MTQLLLLSEQTISAVRRGLLIAFLLYGAGEARQVTVSLWISGGAEGIVDGGRVAPGWMGLLSQLGTRPEREPWIDVGGTRHVPSLIEMKGVRMPEVRVPGEDLFRVAGLDPLSSSPGSWVITNGGILPQFSPEARSFSREWTWTHPDGAPVRVLAVMSDHAPLRIPADRLRPIRVLPTRETIRDFYIDAGNRDVLEVLILGEGMDEKEASRAFPDADVVVEPATGAATIYEISNQTRVRVKPGRGGRSVIRVWAKWDTVTKTFSRPKAEVVWVNPCVYTDISLPPALHDQVRTLRGSSLHNEVDVIWEPEWASMNTDTQRPDGIRAQRVPQDDAWMKVHVPASIWSKWKSVPEARWQWTGESRPRSPWVALPATVAAGRGSWECPIRLDLLQSEIKGTWLSLTTRDLINAPANETP